MADSMGHLKNVQDGAAAAGDFLKERSNIFFNPFNKLYVYQP